MNQRFAVHEMATIGEGVVRCVVDAPRVARAASAGQFVIVRPTELSERIPLTIAGWDPAAGTITLVVAVVGATTVQLSKLAVGDHFADVLGSLGRQTELGPFGTCVVVAGGVGAAIALPVTKALTKAGNTVHAIVGAQSSDRLILVDEFAASCAEVTVTTDDGSSGRRGLVTDALTDLITAQPVDHVFTVGPIPMMAAVAAVTRRAAIPTVASLNPIMVDGTGMCGGCRVRVDGEVRFACVDGPEFDAHVVDFDQLASRNRAYREFEECRMAGASVGG